MYYNGHGLEKNWEKAKELYKAASAIDKNAEEMYNHVIKEEQQLKEGTSNNASEQDS